MLLYLCQCTIVGIFMMLYYDVVSLGCNVRCHTDRGLFHLGTLCLCRKHHVEELAVAAKLFQCLLAGALLALLL